MDLLWFRCSLARVIFEQCHDDQVFVFGLNVILNKPNCSLMGSLSVSR